MSSENVTIALGHRDGGNVIGRLDGHRQGACARPDRRHIRSARREPSQVIGIIFDCQAYRATGACSGLQPSIMSDEIAKLNESEVRFARSATRHRVSKDRIRHVIANHRVRFEEPPHEGLGQRSIRVVYLGDDIDGQALEVMAVELDSGRLYVIHAMPLRKKYKTRYEEGR